MEEVWLSMNQTSISADSIDVGTIVDASLFSETFDNNESLFIIARSCWLLGLYGYCIEIAQPRKSPVAVRAIQAMKGKHSTDNSLLRLCSYINLPSRPSSLLCINIHAKTLLFF